MFAILVFPQLVLPLARQRIAFDDFGTEFSPVDQSVQNIVNNILCIGIVLCEHQRKPLFQFGYGSFFDLTGKLVIGVCFITLCEKDSLTRFEFTHSDNMRNGSSAGAIVTDKHAAVSRVIQTVDIVIYLSVNFRDFQCFLFGIGRQRSIVLIIDIFNSFTRIQGVQVFGVFVCDTFFADVELFFV